MGARVTKAVHYWTPSIAVSAITIYDGDEFSEWNGYALITTLKDQSLRKLNFDNLSDIKEEIIFKDKIGRIRDIQVHPINGKIYFLGGDSLWVMEKINLIKFYFLPFQIPLELRRLYSLTH